jgi:hypothetical protein
MAHLCSVLALECYCAWSPLDGNYYAPYQVGHGELHAYWLS